MDLGAALILGLVGSLHCAGMCGPLALALPVPAGVGGFGFLAGRIVYNLGRLGTYALLGLIFGLLGQTLLLAGVQRWLSLVMGVVLLLGLLTSRRLALSTPIARLLARLQGTMSGWLRTRTFGALAMLGALTGLLPCGLVYVACAGATATGHLTTGVAYMVAFGAGTLPMMLGISLSGKLLRAAPRAFLVRLVPVSIFLLAGLLILRGLALGIPYVSPDLGPGGTGCCHGSAHSK